MEDQPTWKGHGFTLMVFSGIVVLCSIFFILGMLVGRTQGQKMATVAAAAEEPASKTAAKGGLQNEAKNEQPPLTFYESAVDKEKPPALEPPPKPEPEAPEPPKTPEATRASASRDVVNYQVAALRRAPEAEKVLDSLKKKGFRAFILAPAGGDPNPFFRVQVGPFADMIEAEQAKKKLETAGYQPILKK